MQRKHGVVGHECALQARTAKERKDGLGFADDRFLDGSVVGDGDLFLGVRLCQSVVKFDGFALGNFNECLDSLFAKRHQFIRSKAAAESLGAGEADAVYVVRLAIKQMQSRDAQHAGEFVLVAAFVIVIAQDRNDGNVNMFEHAQHRAHFFRHAVVGEIARDDQHVGQIVDGQELAHIALVVFSGEMDVGYCGEPHSLLLVVFFSCRGCA